jgi:hypothetical protein
MARFCEKHMERATLTLVNRRDGTEYDLCATCEIELAEILNGKPTEGEEIGRKRVIGRPKTIKK